jgi:hypothetical protein
MKLSAVTNGNSQERGSVKKLASYIIKEYSYFVYSNAKCSVSPKHRNLLHKEQ